MERVCKPLHSATPLLWTHSRPDVTGMKSHFSLYCLTLWNWPGAIIALWHFHSTVPCTGGWGLSCDVTAGWHRHLWAPGLVVWHYQMGLLHSHRSMLTSCSGLEDAGGISRFLLSLQIAALLLFVLLNGCYFLSVYFTELCELQWSAMICNSSFSASTSHDLSMSLSLDQVKDKSEPV